MTSANEIIRQSGIGASEIACVMGISPFGDAWTVYARKHKLIEPPAQTEEMFWGTMLEPVIARVFARRTHLKVEWWNERIQSPERPWQFASPDAFVIGKDKTRQAVVECKTAGLGRSGEWDRDTESADGVPDHYLAQVEWQLSTTGLEVGYIAVLIGGNDFRIYRIEHDPVLEEILLESGEAFWRKHMMADQEPPIGGSDLARQYLRERYPREREKLRAATPDEAGWLNQYADLRGLLSQAEDRREELENQITQAIGDGEGLTWQRGKFTWKRTRDSQKTNWEELARTQLAGLAEGQQESLIGQHTRTVEGYRRIHFGEATR